MKPAGVCAVKDQAKPRPQNPADVGPAFPAALDGFDPARPPLILGHFDADGLAATAILARALDRAGWQRSASPARARTPGRPT